jgi:hypothetical protein
LIQAATGNVGIGTTGPVQKLDVNGNIGVSGTEIVSAARVLQNVTTDGGIITSGTVGLDRGGTAADLSATGGATKILAQDAAHAISARDLVAADIPDLSATYQSLELARKQPVLFTDCILSSTYQAACTPFSIFVVATGTFGLPNAGIVTSSHPGMLKVKSSTTTNSGGLVGSSPVMFLLGGGEAFEVIFNIVTLANGTFRLGFHDSVTSADAVDGVYLEIASTGVATGKTSSSSTRSSTGTTYMVSTATWYRLLITVTSTSRADFYLYDDAGTQLWTDNLTTNIPSAAGQETGAAIIGTNVGTTATDLYHLDWMAVYFTTARTR